jgi:hypothetical protein
VERIVYERLPRISTTVEAIGFCVIAL